MAHPNTSKAHSATSNEQPVTEQHKPFVAVDSDPLKNYGTARATIAASRDAPNGTIKDGWAESHQHQTILEQHCQYFDPDRDGVIWPADTYYACRAWGWAMPLSLFFAAAIHIVQSYGSLPGVMPDPFFRIYIKNLYMCKHGSGSLAIDHEGRFRSQQFEDLFSKFDADGKGGLTAWEIWRALRRHAFTLDFFGQASALAEWTFTYILLWPEDGVLKKEDLRRIYDGSIFFDLAKGNPPKFSKANSSGYKANLVVVPGMLLIGGAAATMILSIVAILGVAVPSILLTGAGAVTLISFIVTLLSMVLHSKWLLDANHGDAGNVQFLVGSLFTPGLFDSATSVKKCCRPPGRKAAIHTLPGLLPWNASAVNSNVTGSSALSTSSVNVTLEWCNRVATTINQAALATESTLSVHGSFPMPAFSFFALLENLGEGFYGPPNCVDQLF